MVAVGSATGVAMTEHATSKSVNNVRISFFMPLIIALAEFPVFVGL